MIIGFEPAIFGQVSGVYRKQRECEYESGFSLRSKQKNRDRVIALALKLTLFLVDKTSEISNHGLVRDKVKIIDLEGIFSIRLKFIIFNNQIKILR